MPVPAETLPIHVRPEPFSAYTTPEFWNDPHVSTQLLQAHLDPDSAPASRPDAFIERSAEWLVQALGLGPGDRVLDLGCGPGLYANRLAGRGLQVVGLDVSRSSLQYARDSAQSTSTVVPDSTSNVIPGSTSNVIPDSTSSVIPDSTSNVIPDSTSNVIPAKAGITASDQPAQGPGLPATFIEGNYLEVDLGSGYDAALLIYADFCALSFEQRSSLLQRVLAALRPGGVFVFDVTAAPRFAQYRDGVELLPADGFWAAGPHVATRATWTYPELRLVLERHVIQTPAGVREFWNWTHCLTAFEVEAELASAGFADFRRFGDVAGADYNPDADTFALLARRPG